MLLAQDVVIAERFRLERPLGKGGMGAVWIAHHLGLDIPCAIKFIEGTIADDPEMRMRFEREAKAAAHLRSPNVVQIFDHGIHDGTPYIAMELLVGEDLRHRLDRVTRLPPRETAAIVEQVCRALTRAHAAGIVHRDLKPENIFLVKDDDAEIAKVLDFGIAKQQTLGGEGASHTRTGALMGSPYYMSPEQAQGAKTLDQRSDLWSMAVIVYECVTGVRPFESDALGELVLKICVRPVPVPSQTGHAPPTFDAWWARAATREPAGRFQTARELSDALLVAFGAQPITGYATGRLPPGAVAAAASGPNAVQTGAFSQSGSALGPAAARTTSGTSSMSPAAPKASSPVGAIVAVLAMLVVAGLGSVALVWRAHAGKGGSAEPPVAVATPSAPPSAQAPAPVDRVAMQAVAVDPAPAAPPPPAASDVPAEPAPHRPGVRAAVAPPVTPAHGAATAAATPAARPSAAPAAKPPQPGPAAHGPAAAPGDPTGF